MKKALWLVNLNKLNFPKSHLSLKNNKREKKESKEKKNTAVVTDFKKSGFRFLSVFGRVNYIKGSDHGPLS